MFSALVIGLAQNSLHSSGRGITLPLCLYQLLLDLEQLPSIILLIPGPLSDLLLQCLSLS